MYGDLIPVGGGDPIPLRKTELLVGRKKDCDIVLDFSNVSGQHCRLVLSGGYWFVLDLHSTNGVKVNGVRVTDRRIDPGQTVHISKHAYRLEYNPARNGATGPAPAAVLQEAELMSRSLMEKAGLQRPPTIAKDLGSTIPDMPIVVTPPSSVKKPSTVHDFHAELVFD